MPHWDEHDPVSRPWHVTEQDWLSLTPGERVRALREREEEFQLSAEQYKELARLPFWMFYGPEHGLPKEIFNDRGFILPKYRPGGGSYSEFRSWRKRFRAARWCQYLALKRCRRIYDRVAPMASILGLGALLVASVLRKGPFESRSESGVAFVLTILVTFVACAALMLLIHIALRIGLLIVSRRAARRVASRSR